MTSLFSFVILFCMLTPEELKDIDKFCKDNAPDGVHPDDIDLCETVGGWTSDLMKGGSAIIEGPVSPTPEDAIRNMILLFTSKA